MTYEDFLKSKQKTVAPSGFDCDPSNAYLFEFQRLIVKWALRKGKAALFLDTGLGKTLCQLSWADEVVKRTGGNVLIVAPLAVSKQTKREGDKFGVAVNICRTQADVAPGVNITNYEMLDHFDAEAFVGVVLDESSILKHSTSKTREYVTSKFAKTPYRLACTATPAPNDYMELGNHAEFLGVMSRTEMLSTYFVHDSGETQTWRLKGHAADKFWEWIATWAATLQNPRDLGCDGSAYDLPPMNIVEHKIDMSFYENADGQMLLFPSTSQTLAERRHYRKISIAQRVQRAAEIANATDEQCLVWCDLNAESAELAKAITDSVEVSGSHSDDHKTSAMMGFTDGQVRVLISKPSIAGWGMNWQNCRNVIFVGLSDSFEAYYQAVRRCWRFGQTKQVNVHIITSNAEGVVADNIKRKQRNAQRMAQYLTEKTRDILYAETHGTQRITETYKPVAGIQLPAFLERMVA